MPSILDQIVASVRAAEADAERDTPLDALLAAARARAGEPKRSLRAALTASECPRIIAEIKRASPSKGDIRLDVDAADLARRYEAGGAAAISVLTEPAFFKGSPDDLLAARAAVSLPVLRKDFILTAYAVAASAAMGADALLLIVRLLDAATLARLHAFAQELGLECLVEIHDEADLQKLAAFHPPIVGINNRNLATFDTDLGTAVRLARQLPPDTIPVALSGISTPADIAAARAAGLSRFLIGEALVRAPDPSALLRAMTQASGRGSTGVPPVAERHGRDGHATAGDAFGGSTGVSPVAEGHGRDGHATFPMRPQVKICGLTQPDQALSCADAGADAIGFVFHAPSPRNVTPEQARGMVETLPRHVVPVGVFVTQTGAEIAAIAQTAGLRTVQLHGPAMPDTAPLRAAGLRIVRVLFGLVAPDPLPDADAFLIECGRGTLPGGNGQPWDWAAASSLIAALPRPCGLAGGLADDNVAHALAVSGAAAADASSSVEDAPGLKNLGAVRRFIAAAHAAPAVSRHSVF